VKIDDASKKAASVGVATTQTRSGKSAEKAGASPPSLDNVRLSTPAQVLTGQVASSAVFDSGKVAEIKDAIESGTFKVDVEKITDALMDTVGDLIKTRVKAKM
jgi:negative regulator of flagellin synthesis FlgM